ncbi:MAG: radical SAM protein [Planctomycetota bacterium]|jgi:heme b synthase
MAKDFPRLVFWETTAGCNLECAHCRRLDVSREMMKSDLTTDEAKRFLGSLSEYSRAHAKQMPTILVLSGGEPLIRPDIFELARFAGDAGLVVSLATNGTLIDDATAKKIADTGIRRVAVSIDGADATTHDAFRKQPGSLQRALDGFRRLKKLGMSLQINCTVTRHNVHERDRIFDLAEEVGAEGLHLFMLVPVGCGVEIAETNMLSAEEYEDVLHWFYLRAQKSELHAKATCAPHYYRILREEAKKEGRKVTPKTHGLDAMTKGCLAGTGVCFVSHEGKVFPCGYLPVECGDVKKQSFEEIWEGSGVFASLRDDSALGGKCGVCEYRRVCMGCRARAFAETGNFMEEVPYCIYTPGKLREGSS